jgi:HAD superfamily hydrolase (TIGR01549 family)
MASRFKAVLFDVDGTLYRQGRLRAAMAVELAAASLGGGVRAARIVKHYRDAHERLRQMGASDRPLAALQIERTAADAGVNAADVAATVEEWMVRRPLKYLRWCRRPELLALLDGLERAGLKIGALSDYVPDAKLDALEAARYFSLSLCTTDSRVNALKPHPKGFQVACELWGVRPEEVLYVGDRPDVDGEGAVAAGLACAILHRGGVSSGSRGWRAIERLGQVTDVIAGR